MTLDLPRPLAVVAHDAGAANILFAWLARDGLDDVQAALAGPAAEIWKGRFGDLPFASDPAAVLTDARSLLTGTGWASDLEHRARVLAASNGQYSVALIDHWVNYEGRFTRNTTQLPDAVWVTDKHALSLARAAFPDLRIDCRPNLYLEEQAAEAGPVPPGGGVLFVAEPARSTWGGDRPGELQALDYFMASRGRAGIPPSAPVCLRPHPSDPPGKYANWLAANEDVRLDTSRDLGAALAEARWVVGMNSMALVVALAAGRTAISALPPGAPACRLPHERLIRL